MLGGYAGAFRRSEVAEFSASDLEFSGDGVIIPVRWSKTDQEGAGREVGLLWGAHAATSPVRALRHWLEEADISEVPLLRAVNRHGQISASGLNKDSIGTIIKRALLLAGISAEQFLDALRPVLGASIQSIVSGRRKKAANGT